MEVGEGNTFRGSRLVSAWRKVLLLSNQFGFFLKYNGKKLVGKQGNFMYAMQERERRNTSNSTSFPRLRAVNGPQSQESMSPTVQDAFQSDRKSVV